MALLIDRVAQLTVIQTEARELFEKKNADYGDAFAEYGVIGILVRLGDKIKRLQSITNNGITLVEDEKLRDTLIDLHNYAAMGIMLISQGYDGTAQVDKVDKLDTNMKELNVVDEPVKGNLLIWNIKGSMGDSYKRERYVDAAGSEVNTCSCPSFKYCKSAIRTCKHIGG